MGTTNLDDLLNQAEAQEASNDEWVLDSKYETKDFYVDEHGTVEIKNKTIGNMSSHISVKGESYSQYIEFKINRFYDGVDLTTMSLAIYYEIPNVGGDESRPINVYYNEMEIKFGWAIPSEITQNNLTIELCIYFRGKLPDGKEYVLKTKPANYLINNGLEFGSGIIQPTNNWYLNFVLEMDSKVNIATNAASQSLNSSNNAKDSESIVLQYKQVVEEKAETVNEQYLEVQTMHMEAKNYRDEAEQFRNEAEQFTPDGYDSLVEQVNKNTVAISTIVEKAELNIKETAMGDNIHLIDSADSKLVELALYGKATQNTTSGKQLLSYPYYQTTRTESGITFTDNGDGSIHVKGTATSKTRFMLTDYLGSFVLSAGKYIVSCEGIVNSAMYFIVELYDSGTYKKSYSTIIETEVSFDILQTDLDSCVNPNLYVYFDIDASRKVDTTIYPMIRLASITDDDWEPYTGSQPSPSPNYPQEIEVAGESYNLLENTATSQTINGIEFVVNEDGSVTANGTATAQITFDLIPRESAMFTDLIGEELILSGCPIGGGQNIYQLQAFTTGFTSGATDRGSGLKFALTDSIAYAYITIFSGVTVDNVTFKPMIRKASVKNDRYMPYGKGSVEVKSVGKNLLKNTYTSKTVYGVDFTVNNDKSVTLNGTADKSVAGGESTIGTVKLKKGKYILSGCPSGGSNETYRLIALINYEDGTTDTSWRTFGDEVEFNIQKEVREILVRTDIMSGVTANNLTFYPMIRLATEKDTTYKPYEETISTIPTTDFAGIKVSSGGNYTDSNGQQWICDEIVKYADGSGEKIQRIGKRVFDGSETWSKDGRGRWISNVLKGYVKPSSMVALCDKYLIKTASQTYAKNMGISIDGSENIIIYDSNHAESDVATWNEYLSTNNVILYYELAEPIRTPLTSEEIAEIEKLSTFYSVTNISNDFDFGMKVTYVVDAKTYIDNQLELQAQAREEEMMSMFLLLPDEVQASMIDNDMSNLMSGMED